MQSLRFENMYTAAHHTPQIRNARLELSRGRTETCFHLQEPIAFIMLHVMLDCACAKVIHKLLVAASDLHILFFCQSKHVQSDASVCQQWWQARHVLSHCMCAPDEGAALQSSSGSHGWHSWHACRFRFHESVLLSLLLLLLSVPPAGAPAPDSLRYFVCQRFAALVDGMPPAGLNQTTAPTSFSNARRFPNIKSRI